MQNQPPETVRRAIARIVQQLYGGVGPRSFTGSIVEAHRGLEITEKSPENPPSSPSQIAASNDKAAGTAESTDEEAKDEDPTLVASESSGDKLRVVIDWSAQIDVQHDELGSSFSIPIFLGEVPEDPSEWLTCPSFVGAHFEFVNPSAEECANCRAQSGIVTHGVVYLNDAIAERSGLGSFDPSVVEPYLKRELSWRVLKVCCESISRFYFESSQKG